MTAARETDHESNGVGVALAEGDASHEAQQAGAVADPGPSESPEEGQGQVKKAEFQPISEAQAKGSPAGMDLLMDVTLPVSIELGRTTMSVKEVISICQGSVIELDKAAGEPVDILIGNKRVGKCEVVVLNDRFGVRVTELFGPVEGVAKP
jgi:flagellar motor switch protein FliN/FliY